MARIRTVKPQLARHLPLFELEKKSGLPIRYIWAMLPTICDREGRFAWRPWELKLDICPYDEFDFSTVLDLLHEAGMLVKYEFGGEFFGAVPTFAKHQKPNAREAASTHPNPSDGKVIHVKHFTCMHVQDHGEGKGREREREGEREGGLVKIQTTPAPSGPGARELIATYCGEWEARYRTKPPRPSGKDRGNFKTLLKDHGFTEAQRLIQAYFQMPDQWFVTKTHDVPTLLANIPKVTLYANSGKMITRKEVRDLDDAVALQNLKEQINLEGI